MGPRQDPDCSPFPFPFPFPSTFTHTLWPTSSSRFELARGRWIEPCPGAGAHCIWPTQPLALNLHERTGRNGEWWTIASQMHISPAPSSPVPQLSTSSHFWEVSSPAGALFICDGSGHRLGIDLGVNCQLAAGQNISLGQKQKRNDSARAELVFVSWFGDVGPI